MEFLFQLVLVILLVLLNGFFVASEFALVGVRKTRIEELVRRKKPVAKLVQAAIEDLETYISATQLGITLASLALGWIGEPAIAHFLEPYLTFLPTSAAFITAHTFAVIVAFTIISFLHIVLGELAPKTIALQKAEATSFIIIAPLTLFAKLFKPFIFILNGAGGLVLRPFGFSAPPGHQLVHSEEEIKIILAQSGQEGIIEKEEMEMLINVFKLGDILVSQIMVHRPDIVAFSVAQPIKDVLKKTGSSVFSRFPVFEQSLDTIVGFIHVKDVYTIARTVDENTKLSQTSIVREIITIPEIKRADEALLEMRRKQTHMAVVNDEFGNTAGIITLEDIIESLVGEIQDEFDTPSNEFNKVGKESYLVNGLTTIDAVQKKLNLPLKGMGYTTIGGLVFGLLGHQPIIGDKVQLGNILLVVEELDRKRIKSLLITRQTKGKLR